MHSHSLPPKHHPSQFTTTLGPRPNFPRESRTHPLGPIPNSAALTLMPTIHPEHVILNNPGPFRFTEEDYPLDYPNLGEPIGPDLLPVIPAVPDYPDYPDLPVGPPPTRAPIIPSRPPTRPPKPTPFEQALELAFSRPQPPQPNQPPPPSPRPNTSSQRPPNTLEAELETPFSRPRPNSIPLPPMPTEPPTRVVGTDVAVNEAPNPSFLRPIPIPNISNSVHPAIRPPHPTIRPAHPTIHPAHPTIGPTHPTIRPTHPTIRPTHPTIRPAHPTIHPTIRPTTVPPLDHTTYYPITHPPTPRPNPYPIPHSTPYPVVAYKPRPLPSTYPTHHPPTLLQQHTHPHAHPDAHNIHHAHPHPHNIHHAHPQAHFSSTAPSHGVPIHPGPSHPFSLSHPNVVVPSSTTKPVKHHNIDVKPRPTVNKSYIHTTPGTKGTELLPQNIEWNQFYRFHWLRI